MELSTMVSLLLKAYAVSLQIFALTLVGAVPLGIPLALGRLSRLRPLSLACQLFISLLRGTPLMLQMWAVYFVPFSVFGIPLSSNFMPAIIVAFVINYAAYFAEIYRSGIQSMPRGQYEAAEVLGYSKRQTFFRIILPQVVKRILPTMGNELVTLVKDTSLAFALGLSTEMFAVARAFASGQRSMLPFAIAALIYWLTCLVIEYLMRRAERKLAYYHD